MALFYCMGYKALYTLQEVCNAGLGSKIEHVIIGTDQSVQNDYSEEIINFLSEANIDFSSKRQDSKSKHNLAIAIGWRFIIHDQPNLIVLHDSLLPKYRGFNPLVSQLIDGEKKIGATAIYASDRYDEGNIICQGSIGIGYPIKIRSAIEKVSSCYAKCVKEILSIEDPLELKGTPQDHSQATYSVWRDSQDYLIDWSQSSHYIERFINAVGWPYQGAQTYMNGTKIVIESAKAESHDLFIHNRQPGKVIEVNNGLPIIICGEGLLRIESANYINKNKSVLPLTKFRTRLSSTTLCNPNP